MTRDDAFRSRVTQLLGALGQQYPTLFVPVDLYRPAVLHPAQSSDDATLEYVKLGDQVTAFNFETMDRFWQADVGLIQQKVNNLILPGTYDLLAGDYVIIAGRAYMVTDAQDVLGVTKCIIDAPKAHWVVPQRGSPTYRQMGLGAYVA